MRSEFLLDLGPSNAWACLLYSRFWKCWRKMNFHPRFFVRCSNQRSNELPNPLTEFLLFLWFACSHEGFHWIYCSFQMDLWCLRKIEFLWDWLKSPSNWLDSLLGRPRKFQQHLLCKVDRCNECRLKWFADRCFPSLHTVFFYHGKERLL